MASAPVDVWVTQDRPYVQVWVDGKVYETFVLSTGFLTWSQLDDIAKNYADLLSWEIDYYA